MLQWIENKAQGFGGIFAIEIFSLNITVSWLQATISLTTDLLQDGSLLKGATASWSKESEPVLVMPAGFSQQIYMFKATLSFKCSDDFL